MPRPDPPLPLGATGLRIRPCPSRRHHEYTRTPDRDSAEKLIQLMFQIRQDVDAWAVIGPRGTLLAIRTRPGKDAPSLGQGRLF